MYDLLIKGGQVVDGTGARERFRADVAVTNGIIEKIGILEGVPARETTDAKGLVVAPGFIDVLNRSDAYLTLFTQPGQESLLSQGITTIIGGNCGHSLAPLVSGDVVAAEQQWTDPQQINVDWLRMGEYLDRLSAKKLPLNFGTLAGYQTVVRGVLRESDRAANEQEHEIARFLCSQALTDGALGISYGLFPFHEAHDESKVMRDVFKCAALHGTVASIHLRDEPDRFLDSLGMVMRAAEEERVRLHISHLKVIDRKFWSNFSRALAVIEQAKRRGLSVTFDVFPYASSSIALHLLLPAWAQKGGPEALLRRLSHAHERKQIVKDMQAYAIDYAKITVAARAPDAVYIGKTVAELAKDLGIDGAEVIVELLAASRLRIVVFAHTLDEANVRAGIAHPLSIVAGGGAGYDRGARTAQTDLPHPRSFGAFPRFLHKYAHDDSQFLSLERAVAKATSSPAHVFGVSRRGVCAQGYAADLIVFDPRTMADAATFHDPYRYSRGVAHVFVNGARVFSGGEFSGNLPGVVVRHTG